MARIARVVAKVQDIRQHGQTGRPLGSERFVAKLEKTLGRFLRRQKPGRKKKTIEK